MPIVGAVIRHEFEVDISPVWENGSLLPDYMQDSQLRELIVEHLQENNKSEKKNNRLASRTVSTLAHLFRPLGDNYFRSVKNQIGYNKTSYEHYFMIGALREIKTASSYKDLLDRLGVEDESVSSPLGDGYLRIAKGALAIFGVV